MNWRGRHDERRLLHEFRPYHLARSAPSLFGLSERGDRFDRVEVASTSGRIRGRTCGKSRSSGLLVPEACWERSSHPRVVGMVHGLQLGPPMAAVAGYSRPESRSVVVSRRPARDPV